MGGASRQAALSASGQRTTADTRKVTLDEFKGMSEYDAFEAFRKKRERMAKAKIGQETAGAIRAGQHKRPDSGPAPDETDNYIRALSRISTERRLRSGSTGAKPSILGTTGGLRR